MRARFRLHHSPRTRTTNRGTGTARVCASGIYDKSGSGSINASIETSQTSGWMRHVRVPQPKVCREGAHIALPTVAAESPRRRTGGSPWPNAAAAADGREVRQVELISLQGRFRFGPGRAGRVPPGRSDIAAAHGRQGRRGGRNVFYYNDLGEV